MGAAVLLTVTLTNRKKQAKDELAVYVNGALYITSPLRAGQDLAVEQEDGSVNVIHMTEDGFFMKSSTCENQDCVFQGDVTRQNWYRRLLGPHVLCLPNRVDVFLIVESTDPNVPDM